LINIVPLLENDPTIVRLLAERMRETLVEVLGPERGGSLYTLAWLENRVLEHLEPILGPSRVLLAREPEATVVGHSLLRTDDWQGERVGLVSTTYVLGSFRRQGVGRRLLRAAEAWFADNHLPVSSTVTEPANQKLINLYLGEGYHLETVNQNFVRLSRRLSELQHASDKAATGASDIAESRMQVPGDST